MDEKCYEVELSVHSCGEGEVFHDIKTFYDKNNAIKYAKNWKKQNDDDDCNVTIYETVKRQIEF